MVDIEYHRLELNISRQGKIPPYSDQNPFSAAAGGKLSSNSDKNNTIWLFSIGYVLFSLKYQMMVWRYLLESSGVPGSGQRNVGQEGLSLLTLLTLTLPPDSGAPFLALTSSDSNTLPLFSFIPAKGRVAHFPWIIYQPPPIISPIIVFFWFPKDYCDRGPKSGHYCLSPEIVATLILLDPVWTPLFIKKKTHKQRRMKS